MSHKRHGVYILVCQQNHHHHNTNVGMIRGVVQGHASAFNKTVVAFQTTLHYSYSIVRNSNTQASEDKVDEE